MQVNLGFDLANVLLRKMDTEESIWALDGDLADSTGSVVVQKERPDRFIMVGIAEQNLVSIAAGMASRGIRPFAFSFAAFLVYRALDQIRVGISQTNMPVTLVATHAGGLVGRNGKTHTAVNDIAIMSLFNNIDIWSPVDRDDVEYMLTSILKVDKAAYVRLPRGYPSPLQTNVPRGNAIWLRKPTNGCAIVSTGISTSWTNDLFHSHGIPDGTVGHLHCLNISDVDTLQAHLAGLLKVIVVEDHTRGRGLSRIISEISTAEQANFGWPITFQGKSGSDHDLRMQYSMDSRSILDFLAKEGAFSR